VELFPSPLHVSDLRVGHYKQPAPLETHRPIRWEGDDGRNVFLEIQGNFAAVAFRKGPRVDKVPLRGEVKGFSAASRLRLFKKINRLDFERVGRCTFCTFTWRDDLDFPLPEVITIARSHCQRSIERMANTKLCGVWRVEWKTRKTGIRTGQAMPHVHVIYFGVPWLDRKKVSQAWGQAIGTTKGVSVKLEEIGNMRKCLYYVSKYIAKLDELDRRDSLGNLDIASYLTSYLPGRKWGMYRPELFPAAEKFEMRVEPGPLADKLRAIARSAYAKTPECPESGFCIFGPAAQLIQAEIDKHLLTGAGKPLSS
jgi:hypothetical protein